MGSPHRVGVYQDVPYAGNPGLVRNIIQIALGICILKIYRWRNNAVLKRQAGSGQLQRGRGAHGVPDHGFDRTNWNVVDVSAKSVLEGASLDEVVVW